jgi:FKBP-type peptidyl-prolyl cis-trans isomerase SlyD
MIAKGKVVSLKYLLKNSEGVELDRAEADEPFEYLHGADQILRSLEASLEKLKVGDKKTVRLTPADGYGEVNPHLRLTLERSALPADMPLEPGLQFEASIGDGQDAVFTIQKVEKEKILVDGNHPLAGQTLCFDLEVVAVRDATPEELSHGHAHGPGGHEH